MIKILNLVIENYIWVIKNYISKIILKLAIFFLSFLFQIKSKILNAIFIIFRILF